ncbi:MAG: haloacid dehalogenase, partial [Haloplasmataceae bacterium]|nr:haloacid dehalogenase [Haloplasmataceae bacterium]
MNYKAIVLDLDGTLMTSKNEISLITQNLLIEIQKQGITVILASGRPTYGILKASEKLQLQNYGGYILAYNGGKIINMKNRQVIHESSLTVPTIHELFDASRDLKVGIMAYTDDYIITQDDDEYIQTESRLNNMPIVRVPHFKDAIQVNSAKCLMTAEESHLVHVEQILKDKYSESLSISRSLPYFLECMPKGIDKAQCLAILVNYLNLTKDEVIAIGDGYNDVS